MPTSGDRHETPRASAFFAKISLRNFLIFTLKATIAISLLFWLVGSGRLELSQLRNIQWSAGNLGLVLTGMGAVVAGILLLGWRLCLMVRSVGIELPFSRAFSLTSIGLFSGSILPGVVGGDIIKIIYLCRSEGSAQRTKATIAVMCDRIVGLYSLFLLGFILLVGAWASGSLPFWSPVLIVAPAIVLGLTGLLALFANRRLAEKLPPENDSSNPASLLQMAISVGKHFAGRPSLLAGCIGLSLVNHSLVGCTFLLAAELLGGSDISLMQQLMLNPLAMVINVIPITPGGVGMTESAFSYLYDAAGCSLGAAIGILGRSIQYVAYTASGIPAFILHRK